MFVGVLHNFVGCHVVRAWHLGNFNVFKEFAGPGNGYTVVLKQLRQQFGLIEQFKFFDTLYFIRW